MKRVYIFQETHPEAVNVANSYFRILNNKSKDYITPKLINECVIECGNYEISFLSKRQWEMKLSQDPQSGYLTIPYNRILLSTKNGVKPEQCNLKGLQALLVEDKNNLESGIE